MAAAALQGLLAKLRLSVKIRNKISEGSLCPICSAVNHLRTYFHTSEGIVKAVDDVCFSVKPGETLGIVGESGSGKTVTSLSILQLLSTRTGEINGEILFMGKDLLKNNEKSNAGDTRQRYFNDISGTHDLAESRIYHRVSDDGNDTPASETAEAGGI